MSRIISVTNQKGGVGKTTTAINLAACLAEKGKRVLAVDTDPQGNMSSGLSLNKNELEYTTYELLLGEVDIKDAISRNVYENLDIVGANVNLSAVEVELAGKEDVHYILQGILESVREDYDFIIIDCPPSLNLLTLNSLVASDSVIVPIQCEYFALEGLSQLMHTINLVQERLNPNLFIEGVVFTMYDARTNLSLQVVENVKDNIEQNIYKTIIPRNVRLAEAPSHGMPINLYDTKSVGAEQYRMLADEVIEKEF